MAPALYKGAEEIRQATKGGDEGAKPPSSQIDRAAFANTREAYWQAEAANNSGVYSESDLSRMRDGRPPMGSDGYPMELHHVDGTPEGDLQPMTRTEHRLGDNYKINHPWPGN